MEWFKSLQDKFRSTVQVPEAASKQEPVNLWKLPEPAGKSGDAALRPTSPENDEMVRWLKGVVEDLEETHFGNYIVNSAAGQELLAELYRANREMAPKLPLHGLGWSLGEVVRGLWQPEWNWRPHLGNIGRLPLPSLAGWRSRLTLPRLRLPGFNVSAPGVSAFSAMPAADSRTLGWLLLAAGAGVLLWTWSRSSQRQGFPGDRSRAIGPALPRTSAPAPGHPGLRPPGCAAAGEAGRLLESSPHRRRRRGHGKHGRRCRPPAGRSV